MERPLDLISVNVLQLCVKAPIHHLEVDHLKHNPLERYSLKVALSDLCDCVLVERCEFEQVLFAIRIQVFVDAQVLQCFAPLLIYPFLVVLSHDFDFGLLFGLVLFQ